MKVALTQFIYESNTFNPVEAGLEFFTEQGTWLTDPEAIREWAQNSDSQLQGSLEVFAEAGCETAPAFVAMCGTPGGRLTRECYQRVRETFRESISRTLPVDAMVLHLHGAVCATGEDDVEGDLLAMVREELGFTGRVIVSLDLHANVTERMLEHSDVMTAYRTFPHMDFRETGTRAAQLLLRISGATTRTIAKLATLIPPTATDHRHGNFATILQRARELESAPEILEISLFPVQPWLDIEGLGTSVVVTAKNSESGARVARQLADEWYAQRDTWATGLLEWDTIIATLSGAPAKPWLLVDTADATTGGSDGTSAEAIERLWPHRETLPGEVLLWVVDPEAVTNENAGPSRLQLGASRFTVDGEITFHGECRFRPRGRAYTGQEFSCGRTMVIETGRLRIVVTEQGCLCADPAFYECLGLAPDTALAVQVKSHMGWQAGYEVGPERGLRFDGPGCTSLNFARLPYTGQRRALFPFNDNPPTPVLLS